MPIFLSNCVHRQRLLHLLRLVVVVLVGIFFIALRNPDPLFNPIMYTEDGQWVGVALSKGWLYALENAKQGYFVWGNLLFLFAAVKASEVICGGALVCLPQSVAFFSYLFFSLVATLAYCTTKKIIPQFARISIFFLILLMPLGDSSNEIIGRISNIGYLCVFLSVLLLFNRMYCGAGFRFLIDLLLIFCVSTNPVCIPIVLFFLIFSFFVLRNSSVFVFLRDNIFLLVCLFFLLLLIAMRAVDSQAASVTGSLQLQNLIEAALGRAILYPFVFWMYNSLEDVSVIILTCALLFFSFFMWRRVLDNRAKLLVGMTVVAFFIYLFFTLAMRRSLTEQLGGYLTTFPDRYFMGLNCLVMFAVVVLVGSVFKQGRSRVACYTVFSTIAAVYLVNIPWIFEVDAPRMKIANGHLFGEELCLSRLVSDKSQRPVVLPIFFKGWSMVVPAADVIAAAPHLRCSEVWGRFFITDRNWSRGVGRTSAAIFLPDRPEISSLLMGAKKIKFTNDEVREVVRVEVVGDYINVFFKGGGLDGDKVGLPNEIEVIK